jgi:hypothetical protein
VRHGGETDIQEQAASDCSHGDSSFVLRSPDQRTNLQGAGAGHSSSRQSTFTLIVVYVNLSRPTCDGLAAAFGLPDDESQLRHSAPSPEGDDNRGENQRDGDEYEQRVDVTA